MSLLLVLGLTFAAIVCFVAELLPPALVALVVMAVLMVTGVIGPESGFSGFSDSATLTVAAMFVLSAGLEQTGVVDRLGVSLSRGLERHPAAGWLALLVGAAVASGFVNNTAVVAVMIPLAIGAAKRAGSSPSRLLLPLSFASMLGGVCTLMGTSTNLVVSSIVEASGRRPLGFFEMLPLGAVGLVLGLGYLWVVRSRIPERRGGDDLTSAFDMAEYLTRVTVTEAASMVGRPFAESALAREGMDVVRLVREDQVLRVRGETQLRAGDELHIRGRRDVIRTLQAKEGLRVGLGDVRDVDLEDRDRVLVEVAVSSSSAIAGLALSQAKLWSRFDAIALARRRFGTVEHEGLDAKPVAAGDVLLLLIPREKRSEFARAQDFVVISGEVLEPPRRTRMGVAGAILVAVVGLAASGVLPVVVSAPAGAVLMVVTGCLDLDDAYRAIDWDVVFLLAGMLALGKAFAATGADAELSDLLATVYHAAPRGYEDYALVGLLYGLTLTLTSTMSNQATAALLTPIALSAGAALGVSPRPLVMAVVFAASSGFVTPVGYQTNTMVYGAGHYRFGDFVRIGGPLAFLLAILATVSIPTLWPL